MADDRADQDQRGHAQRHAAAGFVDLVDDQVVAPFRRPPEPVIEQPRRDPGQRKQVEKPRMGETGGRHVVQQPEEQGAETADDGGHRQKQGRPFEGRAQVRKPSVEQRAKGNRHMCP